jgi:hypothetical protein
MLHKKYLLLALVTIHPFALPIAASIEYSQEKSNQDVASAIALKTCTICREEKEDAAFTTLSCGHNSFCTDCLTEFIKLAVKSQEQHLIRCPFCSNQLHYQEVIDLLGADAKPYIEAVTFNWARQQEHLKHCPSPDCKFYFINESTCALPITCGQCNKQYCNACLINHDEQILCDQARINNQTPESQANNTWKETHSKQCPRCKINIEKNHGCDHMTCNSCRYEFCWICLEKYPCGGLRHPRPVMQAYALPEPVPLAVRQRLNRFWYNNEHYIKCFAWGGLIALEAYAIYKCFTDEKVRADFHADIARIRNLPATIRSFNLRNIPHIQLPFFR